jgi:hypothetical protein
VNVSEGLDEACVVIREKAAARQRGGRAGWSLRVWVGGSEWGLKVVNNLLDSGVSVHGNRERVVEMMEGCL